MLQIEKVIRKSPLALGRILLPLCSLGVATVLTAQVPPPKTPDKRCLDCHGRAHIAELTPEERRSMVGTWLDPDFKPVQPLITTPRREGKPLALRPELYVPPDALLESVHPKLLCVDCHVDSNLLPHAAELDLASCATNCHEEEVADFATGAHAESLRRGDDLAPRCATCHGGHDMKSPKTRESGLQRLDRSFLCADCHEKHNTDTPAGLDPKALRTSYLASIHGQAVSNSGLLAAAICTDCHSAHEVRRADNPKSWIHRSNISHTCGKCHSKVDGVYEKSIHGRLLADGDERAPVCTDCHTTHSITRTETPAFMLDIVNECGHCHNDPKRAKRGTERYYLTYRASYHGQVTELGATRAARCSNCHGAHDILPVTDVASRVHKTNLIKTCGQAGCHPRANSNFVQFAPHADYHDGKNYPILHGVFIFFVVVMGGVFGFFCLHTLLWLIRSSIERLRRGPRARSTEGLMVQRFSTLDRVNHSIMALSTLALTATGLPLLFADEAWAHPLAEFFGGIMAAGLWHRSFALLLIINLLVHFIGIAVSMSRRQGTVGSWIFGPCSIVPSWQDVKDCLAMFRWFVHMGPKPSFGRWTYWEKFDYWCAILGTLIVTASGLLLWFPTALSILLPGWLFNVAMIVHGYQALLAIGFLYTIHFFNSSLRVEKFPADPVIFTGRMALEELAEERAKEYERLLASGGLEEFRLKAWPKARQNAWVAVGILAMLVGLALLTLIVIAGLGQLQGTGISG